LKKYIFSEKNHKNKTILKKTQNLGKNNLNTTYFNLFHLKSN